MGKTKKDTNARVARRRKQRKESAAEQLCVVNCAWIIFQMVSMSPTIRRYRTHQKSLGQNPCYCCQVPKFLQNLSFLLPRIFCPPYTIAIASSAWRTFASLLIDVFSFVRRCFRIFELVHVFNVVYVYLYLNRVTRNTKNAWESQQHADQVSSHFVISVQVIPAKIVSVDCIRTMGLSIVFYSSNRQGSVKSAEKH